MRIIGGAYRGQKIVLPKNFKSRPTTDFAREALFNFLTNQDTPSEPSFLDLFGGSGMISFEAFSRGYRPVYTLELDVNNYRSIRQNAVLFGDEQPQILRQDAFRWIKKAPQAFDVVFLDPPFTSIRKIIPLLSQIIEGEVLAAGGLLVVEHPKEFDPADCGYEFESRIFGNQSFSIFTKN